MEDILKIMEPLLVAYSGQYGVIVQVLAYIVSVRAVAKGLEKLIGAVVKMTSSKSDDAWWIKIQSKKLYKFVMVVLDWSTTVKLPENNKK